MNASRKERTCKEKTRRIDLEIRRAVEPIHGLVHEGGRSVAFSGWLGLASALGRLVGSNSDRSVSENAEQNLTRTEHRSDDVQNETVES